MGNYNLVNDNGIVKKLNASRSEWVALGAYPAAATEVNFLSSLSNRAMLDNESTSIPVGATPSALWGDSTTIYVANSTDSTVTKINRVDGSTTTINVGSTPQSLYGDATTVYVASYGSNSFSKINRADDTVTSRALGHVQTKIWVDDTYLHAINSETSWTAIKKSDNSAIGIGAVANAIAIWGDNTHTCVSSSNGTVKIFKIADSTYATVTVGTTPSSIWGDSTAIYVGNSGSNNVTKILRSNNSVTTITVGTNPFALWGDDTHVYVANNTSSSVTCIKRSDNTTTTIPVGGNPRVVWGDSSYVYVASIATSDIAKIKRTDNTIVTIPGITNCRALWGDDKEVYSANYGSNTITKIARSTTNLTTTVATGTTPDSIWGDANAIYVSNSGSSNVTKINRADNVTTTIAVGTTPWAIWGDAIAVYVANYSSSNVTKINRADNVTTTITVGTNPYSLWGDDTAVYVCNYNSANVTKILRSNNSTTTITVGTTPYAVWGDATAVYVSNYGSDNVTKILRSDNTTTPITVGTGPRAIWGNDTVVYVCNYSSSNVTKILRSDNTTTTIPVGTSPIAIYGGGSAVYVANYGSANITKIIISDNSTSLITLGSNPHSIWSDSVSAYVSNYDTASVTRINLTDSSMSTIATGASPRSIWGDATAIYVAVATPNIVMILPPATSGLLPITEQALLYQLTSPTLLTYTTDLVTVPQSKITAVPKPQLALQTQDTTVSNLKSLAATATSTGNGKVGIILSGDSGATWKGWGVIAWTVAPTTAVPAMTSNTAPSGTVTYSSEYGGGIPAWAAFDRSAAYTDGYAWVTPEGTVTGWLAYTFPSPKIISRYSITSNTVQSRAPRIWTFEGYTGSAWVALGSQVTTASWTSAETKVFDVVNTTAYIGYRVNITANNGDASYLSIAELKLFEATPTYGILATNPTVADAATKSFAPAQVAALSTVQLTELFPTGKLRAGFYLEGDGSFDKLSMTSDLSVPANVNDLSYRVLANGTVVEDYTPYTTARTFSPTIPLSSLAVGSNNVKIEVKNQTGYAGSATAVVVKEAEHRLSSTRTATSIDGGYALSNAILDVDSTAKVKPPSATVLVDNGVLGTGKLYTVALDNTISKVEVN